VLPPREPADTATLFNWKLVEAMRMIASFAGVGYGVLSDYPRERLSRTHKRISERQESHRHASRP